MFRHVPNSIYNILHLPQLVDVRLPQQCYEPGAAVAQITHIQNSVRSFVIDQTMADAISVCLGYGDYTLKMDKELDLVLYAPIVWNTSSQLSIISKGNILIDANIVNNNQYGSLILKSGIEADNLGNVSFTNRGSVVTGDGGYVEIHYNPMKGDEIHKYHNPYDYSQYITSGELSCYMLINDIYDMRDVIYFLSGDYALSRNIDAAITAEWNNGSGFKPIGHKGRNIPFSGNFDGNGYGIKNLYIVRPNEDDVGLFADILGTDSEKAQIKNLNLEDIWVKGHHRVGGLAGNAVYADFINIKLENVTIHATDDYGAVGGLVGTLVYSKLTDISSSHNVKITSSTPYSGELVGAMQASEIDLECHGCVGYAD